MKRILFSLLAMIVVLGMGASANATLILKGQGTSVHGTHNLIYDTDLDITWYDFTRDFTITGSGFELFWGAQFDWATALTVDFNGDILDNWRLPRTVDDIFVNGFDGTTSGGYNITTSEMGHLYYAELGNLGFFDTSGSWPQSGWGLTSTGDFQNLNSDRYWSATEYAATGWIDAWAFSFAKGDQGYDFDDVGYSAIAVRSGDVAAVPEPATLTLLGIGLVGLAGTAIRRKLKGRREKR